MADDLSANIEFLQFIADISDPGTGAIRPSRLAARMGLTEADILRRGQKLGWHEYANGILAVLDAMQAKTACLARALAWYSSPGLTQESLSSADDLVQAGRANEAINVVRRSAAESIDARSRRASAQR